MAEPSAVFDESPEPQSSGDTLLRLENLSKQFPGTLALDRVNFDVRAGEVHVLFGENGAGKSTLIQIVAGVHRPSGGPFTCAASGSIFTRCTTHASSA